MKSVDPMKDRKAKIALDSAMRRVSKAVDKAEKNTESATAARVSAVESARAASEAAVAAEVSAGVAEAAVGPAEAAMAEAHEFLEYCKANCTASVEGSLWWMDRELEEAKKYMPKSKFDKLAAEHTGKKAAAGGGPK